MSPEVQAAIMLVIVVGAFYLGAAAGARTAYRRAMRITYEKMSGLKSDVLNQTLELCAVSVEKWGTKADPKEIATAFRAMKELHRES